MVQLKNQLLEIQIDSPGEVYKSSRFDWTGQISQIIFNGENTFCTTETTDPSVRSIKGIGLCHEYGISTPVGYDKCPVGDYFLKIGVGLLYKDNADPYDFFKTYEVKPAEFTVEQKGNTSVSIVSSAKDKRGFGYKLTRTYQIDGQTLSIHSTLENIGSQKIVTEEYCHNFLAIDKRKVDGSYQLSYDQKIDRNDFTNYVNPSECTIITPEKLTWRSIPESDFFFSNVGKVNSWKLANSLSKVSISETIDFESAYSNLWGKGHVISPELFNEIQLEAGQTGEWTRKYIFNTL